MNPGLHPIDPTSAVGQLRYLVGDTAGADDTSLPDGCRNYAVWSDDALAVALVISGGSLYQAAADLYTQLAAVYAQQGNFSAKADDLSLTIGGNGSLQSIATSFREQAATQAIADANDVFVIAPLPRRRRA